MTAAPNDRARAVIERLSLQPHPEGGWFRETHRSARTVPTAALPDGYSGERRALVTSILFLLAAGERSGWHRVRSEELWLHHHGDDLLLEIGGAGDAPPDVTVERITLGRDATLQAVVPPGAWQRAEPVEGPSGYALVGCVVAPGFDFDDFEMGW